MGQAGTEYSGWRCGGGGPPREPGFGGTQQSLEWPAAGKSLAC